MILIAIYSSIAVTFSDKHTVIHIFLVDVLYALNEINLTLGNNYMLCSVINNH